MIIATRELTLRAGALTQKIVIQVFSPEKSINGSWSCRYEIGWPDKKKIVEAGGFDAMQALISALQMIGADLYATNYHKAGQLFWDKPGQGYGFPVTSGLRDLLVGEDAKYF
jgi:hypothetical protein